MFLHRGLFFAVTISLASIAFAGVLIQPGYQHQYYSNPHFSQDQSAPLYWTQSPIEQYRAEQFPDQESTQYHPGVQTVYLYESGQVNARSSEPVDFSLRYFLYPAWPSYYLYRLLYEASLPKSEQASITEENEDPKEARHKRIEEYDNKINFIRHMDGGRFLQPLEITNMNMIGTAEPNQDKTLQIPFYSEMTPKSHQYANAAATPTSVQSQPPSVTYMQNPYRSKEELSAINEIVGASYGTNNRPYANYNFNYLYNYPSYWNNDWYNDRSSAERMEDFFIQLKKKNDKTSTNAPNRGDIRIYVPYLLNNPKSIFPTTITIEDKRKTMRPRYPVWENDHTQLSVEDERFND